jgi:hypothetical protein
MASDKVQEVAGKIIVAFQNGAIPKAIAPRFILRKDKVPCRGWSWRNQLLTALAGHSDARTFDGWKAAGRHVKKGERSFQILEPVKAPRDNDKGERCFVTVGFKPSPRFGLEQTDGKPMPVDEQVAGFLRSLPLRDVAESWGLKVAAYDGREGGALGMYRHDEAIALGVYNLSTWAHELVHAADDKLGSMREKGQHWRSETVAELGGAILLECMGEGEESDRGGCWEYVRQYAATAEITVEKACLDALERACKAVELILEAAEALKAGQQTPITAPATELVAASQAAG